MSNTHELLSQSLESQKAMVEEIRSLNAKIELLVTHEEPAPTPLYYIGAAIGVAACSLVTWTNQDVGITSWLLLVIALHVSWRSRKASPRDQQNFRERLESTKKQLSKTASTQNK